MARDGGPSEHLIALASALSAMPWADMVKASEHIVDSFGHLRKSDSLDRDGMAQVLSDLAQEILDAARAQTEGEGGT